MKFYVLIFNIIVYRNIFIIWYLIKVCESCEDKKIIIICEVVLYVKIKLWKVKINNIRYMIYFNKCSKDRLLILKL